MMNWLQRLMLFRLMIIIQLKKPDCNTKNEEIEKKNPNHDNYSAINNFTKCSGAIFDERFKKKQNQ